MKKKLLFIHHCGTKSGAANSLITLIENLDRVRFECLVLCPFGSAADAFDLIADKVYRVPELPEVISISGSHSNYLRLVKVFLLFKHLDSVKRIVDEINPDIVHLNEISLSLVAQRLKKKGRIIIMHARVVLDHRTKLLNSFIIRRLNKYADHIICIDESVRNLLKRLERTSVVYNSYQFSHTQLTNILPENKDKFVVLFLANLIKYKGVFDLLEAAKILKNHPDIEIQVAGGNSRPDEFFKSLKGRVLSVFGLVKNNYLIMQTQIERFNLGQTIKLLGNVKEIDRCIVNSKVNIFPSYMDGPSRSIFETGVLGKPSIISLFHKVNDVVEDGVTGLVIDEHSPKQIAEAILKLRNDPALLQSMGDMAREKYLELNNPTKNALKVQRIYDDLLGNFKP